MELEKGKLYQVRFGTDWVIAEYKGRVNGGTVKGLRSDGATEWHEPPMHWWHHVKHSTFRTPIQVQTRPISEDTLAEIERLKAEMSRLEKERNRIFTQLRELCS